MGTSIKRVLRDRRGLSTVEYIIILALIAVACIAAWGTFGDKINREIGHAEQALPSIQGTGPTRGPGGG